MKRAKPYALLGLAFASSLLVGCAGSGSATAPASSNLDWNTPGMQLGGDRGLPLQTYDRKCRKRGCDNHKLFFNPAEQEASADTLHRGW